MNIRELQSALEYSRERLFRAEKQLDATTEPELIDAAIFEQKAWEARCKFYNRKLREALKVNKRYEVSGLFILEIDAENMRGAREKAERIIRDSGIYGIVIQVEEARCNE